MKRITTWIVLGFLLYGGYIVGGNLYCVHKEIGDRCTTEWGTVWAFPSDAQLPVKIQTGDLQDFTIGIQKIPCFVNAVEAECLFPQRHVYIDTPKRRQIERVLEAFVGRQSPQKLNPPVSSRSLGQGVPIRASVGGSNRLYGDVDGDGNDEILVWQKVATKEVGDFYRLSIYRPDGTLLWHSPPSESIDDPYAFGSWDFGESLPEVLIDIDGDGQAELLAPAPASDVSPVFYRIFGYNGRALVARRPGVLLRSRRNPQRFIWVNPVPKDRPVQTWVSRLEPGGSPMEAIAQVVRSDGGESIQMGKVRLRFDRYGAQIVGWIEPLGGTPSPPKSYRARISVADHYNSRGKRLKEIRVILHQDRANYYRGKGDPEDTGIGRFDTPRKRNEIDRMRIVPVGIDGDLLRSDIFYGTPLLQITPEGGALKIRLISL